MVDRKTAEGVIDQIRAQSREDFEMLHGRSEMELLVLLGMMLGELEVRIGRGPLHDLLRRAAMRMEQGLPPVGGRH